MHQIQQKRNVRRKKNDHWIWQHRGQCWLWHLFNGILGTEVLLKWVEMRMDIRHIDQSSRTESPEINPYVYDSYIYDQLIFDKGTKTIQWGNKCLFTNSIEIVGYSHSKEVGFLLHTI